MLLGRRLAGLVVGLSVFLAPFCIPLAAQDQPAADAAADSQLAGIVRAPDGTAIPGSTVRVIQTSTGKAWITWTDEDGKFEFPALPEGHFRIELSQLGFAPATKEIDLHSGVKTPVDLKMDVGTLAAIAAPATPDNATKVASAPPVNENAKSAPAAANPATTATNNEAASPPGGRSGGNGGQRGSGGSGRPGQPGGPAGNGQGGGRRAFQQVGLNGQNQNPAEIGSEDQNVPVQDGQLGQAASADAVQMTGTVAIGLMPPEGFPQPGGGGPDGRGGFGEGIPGQGPPGGGGPGGPGGPGGGPGVFVMRGGGGGGGARGRGPQGGPQGVAALWGAQQLMRQRANRVHISFYDTFGDSALNARPYSLSEANPPKISSWSETAGMNIGGPLKIPHVYDSTDKTFFYINFGGTWSRNAADQFATVPTLAERPAQGGAVADFSSDLGAPLYTTPAGVTTTVSQGNTPLMVTNTNNVALQARQGMIFSPTTGQAYAGNILPGPFNSIATGLLNNFIPLPTPGLTGQQLNYHLQANLPGLSNRLNVNVTHQISSKLSVQVNYNLTNGTSHSLNSFPGIEGNTFTRGQSAMIGLTQNWTKTFVHTSQLYFSRNRSLGLNAFSNVNDISSQLGCPPSPCGINGISGSASDFGLPQINFTNFTGLNDPNFSLSRSQTYRYVDSWRWIQAKHTVSAGGEIRKMDSDRDTDPAPNGQFSFTGAFTSLPNAIGGSSGVSLTGNDLADFLLGYPANAKVQFSNPNNPLNSTATYFHDWGFIAYASDDWHIFPRFTLTYGARYEAFTPPTEQSGHIANLDVSSGFANPQCVTPAPIVTATLTCAAGPTSSLFHGHYNNWAPRLGIAYQPPGKWFSGNHQMTVRAGFSMFYVENYLNTLSGEMANQPPFATANTVSAQPGAAPPLTLQNILTQSSPSAVTNTVAVDPNYKVPYAMIWNFGFEYNLVQDTFLEVMYTGTRGIHLDELLGFGPTNTATTATGFTYDTSGAFSNLNSLQVRLQKRMSHGLMFMARYTYSKSLDDASTIGGGGQTVIQNNADPRGDYGLSSFNMTHQFFGQFSYQLPFGDRQRFATKGWQKNVFGEWRMNGSFTANSGTPYTVRVFSKDSSCQNVPGTNSERADQMSNPALSNPTIQEWFNTSTKVFADPSTDGSLTPCFGNAPRNSVIGPGAFTINSGVTKTVPFGRDGLRRLDFSWNTTNLLNHPNFSGLSTVFGSKTFGEITSVAGMRAMTFTTRFNF